MIDFRQKIWVVALAGLLQLLFLAAALAADPGRVSAVSPSELATKGPVQQVVDLRSTGAFQQAHIPGAVSLPLEELSLQKLEGLGLTPESPIILYGMDETRALQGKMILTALGFRNVSILAGGFSGWLKTWQRVERGAGRADHSPMTGAMSTGLAIAPELHDFGSVEQVRGIVSTSFVVKNTSAAKILITQISTSCDCLQAQAEWRSILPGQTRSLTVYFDPTYRIDPDGEIELYKVFLQTAQHGEYEAAISAKIE